MTNEARDKIAEVIHTETGMEDQVAVRDAADAIIAALPDVVPVKPLVWDKHPDNKEWYAKLREIEGDTFERGYMILRAKLHFTLYDGFGSRARVIGHHTTPDEAKAAASAHHAAQVRAQIGGE